jgi:very-short-patch-repair endonuclease
MLSRGEEELAMHLSIYKVPFVREFKFCPYRRWRADFAVVDAKLLIEVEGGVWVNGRHNRGKGMAEDAAKYNTATLLGWRLLRFTPEMITSGKAIDTVLQALGLLSPLVSTTSTLPTPPKRPRASRSR